MMRLLPVLFVVVFLAACDSSDPGDDLEPVTTGVFVANQGSFTDANGSVSLHDPRSGETSSFLGSVGSTVQSLFVHNDALYVIANSGNRIHVVSLAGGAATTIDNVLSPRYMARTSDSTAYVTSLFGAPGSFSGGKVFEINLRRSTVIDSVDVGDNPEGIAVVDTLAFVANNGFGFGRTVSVINTRTTEVVTTLDVDCDGPRFVLADDDPEVWVLCTGQTFYDDQGNPSGTTNGAIRIIDPETLQITERLDVDGQIMTVGPGQDAALSTGLQQVFVVVDANRILRYDTRSNERIAEIGPLAGDPIGAVGFNPVQERIYVGRVPGFTQAGSVTILDLSGDSLGTFQAGVAPTYFAFRQAD
ncbi:MAG TPA: DUF5074 domain-containing protein [Rhodothermales bacterium]